MVLENERAEVARGVGVVLDACAGALLNEPGENVVGDMRSVASALGLSERFRGDDKPLAWLVQRYYDRFFVSTSPLYVPCQESCLRGSWVDEDGVRRYGATFSAHADHVVRCYGSVGFDWRALRGSELTLKTLKPDSLAVELAFLAHLKRCEARADDPEQAQRCARLARQFGREHLGTWLPLAACMLAEGDDDWYASVASLADVAVASLGGDDLSSSERHS